MTNDSGHMVCRGAFQTIDVQSGPEDFAIDRTGPNGPRLIVAAVRRPHGKEAGTFWAIDLEGPGRFHPENLPVRPEVWPTGISLASVDGRKTLYVTNHPPHGQPAIEVFELRDHALQHCQSLSHRKLLRSPNDVVALANGDAFVSNLGSLFSKGNVVRYEAASREWSTFATGIDFANGVEVDDKERYLFVNSFGAGTMEVYDLHTGAKKTSVPLPGKPDNLQWELEGGILNVALHRTSWRILIHLRRPSFRSPSRGIRADVRDFLADDNQAIRVTPLYDLPDFSGGSTAVVFKNTLYVSQVMGDQIAVVEDCDPPA